MAPPSSSSGTKVILPPANAGPSVASDPKLLLEAFDKYTAASRRALSSSSSSPTTEQSKQPDPIAFLNKHFTTEETLVAQLPGIREAVTERMDLLDDRISGALQRQSETAEATQKHVQEAKASVASLEQRIRQVQQKAGQSETAVREITKDMKKLDLAKRHLQSTITTLKRLHMLIHAVEQLRLACLNQPFPDFQSAANLVDATRLLLRHFDGYMEKVEPMRLLSEKVSDLQGELRFSLVRGFRLVAFGVEKTIELEKITKQKSLNTEAKITQDSVVLMTPTVMAGGVLMIDSLGADVRKEFIHGICQDHLSEYNRLFNPVRKEVKKEQPRVSSFRAQPEAPKEELPENDLENIEKRFVWFRNFLHSFDKKFPDVFPVYWNLHAGLTRVFLRLTRQHILTLLGGANKDKNANNATILLKALQKTILFEKDVAGALQREYGTIFITPEIAAEKTATPARPTPSKNVRKDGGNRSANSSVDGTEGLLHPDDGKASTEQEPVKPFLGLASSAFDNYMGPYIALEEQNMDEQLVESLDDRMVDTRGELPVFTTSTKLFVYIKGSVTRCTALTKGNAFFLLYQAIQDSLRKYAQVLSSKLPPPLAQQAVVAGLSLGSVKLGKKDGEKTTSYRVPPGEEVTVCHVIGTCEYCAETIEALEDLIRDTIDEEFKSKIDMMGQQEAFHDMTAKALRILVSGLETQLEESLKMMTSIDWGIFDEVGEESDYIRYVHKAIQPYVTNARGLLPTSFFRSFCDKFALGFTETYYNTLIRLKRISQPGTQQLLLDVYNLKTLFLKLPVLENASTAAMAGKKSLPAASTIAPAMYTKMVNKQFQKMETLLKVTGTPINMLIDVFKVQWPGGSALDLQTVMSLKGMKRNEQAAMLEKFGLDPVTALKGATINVTSATIVQERLQAVQGHAARVNTDLSQMRQKVDDFRKSFR